MNEDRTATSAPREGDGIVRCDACPVLCRIRPGQAGRLLPLRQRRRRLVRTDPLVLLTARSKPAARGALPRRRATGTAARAAGGAPSSPASAPAPPIPTTSRRPSSCRASIAGVDTRHRRDRGHLQLLRPEGEDRHRPPPRAGAAAVRVEGEQIGHVTTAEYGSQMLSLGGVRHLTGGCKRRATSPAPPCWRCATSEAVEVVDRRRLDASCCRPARAPIVNGMPESACGSAAARPPSASSPSNGTGMWTR